MDHKIFLRSYDVSATFAGPKGEQTPSESDEGPDWFAEVEAESNLQLKVVEKKGLTPGHPSTLLGGPVSNLDTWKVLVYREPKPDLPNMEGDLTPETVISLARSLNNNSREMIIRALTRTVNIPGPGGLPVRTIQRPAPGRSHSARSQPETKKVRTGGVASKPNPDKNQAERDAAKAQKDLMKQRNSLADELRVAHNPEHRDPNALAALDKTLVENLGCLDQKVKEAIVLNVHLRQERLGKPCDVRTTRSTAATKSGGGSSNSEPKQARNDGPGPPKGQSGTSKQGV
jgi:hypothetical protein